MDNLPVFFTLRRDRGNIRLREVGKFLDKGLLQVVEAANTQPGLGSILIVKSL
jgi:hypothetical protein